MQPDLQQEARGIAQGLASGGRHMRPRWREPILDVVCDMLTWESLIYTQNIVAIENILQVMPDHIGYQNIRYWLQETRRFFEERQAEKERTCPT